MAYIIIILSPAWELISFKTTANTARGLENLVFDVERVEDQCGIESTNTSANDPDFFIKHETEFVIGDVERVRVCLVRLDLGELSEEVGMLFLDNKFAVEC